MTVDTQQMRNWIGHTAYDADGDKIGKIDDIYLDEETGKPEWLAVSTGMFGSKVSFVPITGASSQGDDVRLQFSKEQVKGAPTAEPDGALSQQEEADLYRHYGMNYSESRSDSGLPEGGTAYTGDTQQKSRTTSGHDNAMTRSEEELRVGKTQHEAGRVRLRKWVENERVTQTVPVTKERVTVEREAVNSSNIGDAMDGPEITENEFEVTVHEERAVAETEVVPKERIRLDKERVTEQEQISADLRKERVEVDDESGVTRP